MPPNPNNPSYANENWLNSERNTTWQPGKKVKVVCEACKHQFFLTGAEMAHIVKEVLMGQMAENYDAPVREMLYGALDKHGARRIGRELQRQVCSGKSTAAVKARAMDIIAGLMKHVERMNPPQLTVEGMSRAELERELDRRLGIKRETPSGEDAGEPPAWMRKVVDEPEQPAAGE